MALLNLDLFLVVDTMPSDSTNSSVVIKLPSPYATINLEYTSRQELNTGGRSWWQCRLNSGLNRFITKIRVLIR